MRLIEILEPLSNKGKCDLTEYVETFHCELDVNWALARSIGDGFHLIKFRRGGGSN